MFVVTFPCRSFDLIHSPQGELKAVFLLQNNLVELYSLSTSLPTPQPVRTSRITIGGHRSDVRTLSFSSDNIAVLSAAAESIKIWNRSVSDAFSLKCFWYAWWLALILKNLNTVQSEDTVRAFGSSTEPIIRFWCGAGDTAQQVKTCHSGPEFDPWNPHSWKWELAPASCLLCICACSSP